jgi:hypothetical protein
MENMRIDVDLCGQLLIMHRRRAHLTRLASILDRLTHNLSTSNAQLKSDYRAHEGELGELDARLKVVAKTDEVHARAETILLEARALSYESGQFAPGELWRSVAAQRHKVFATRQKVMGANRPEGAAGGGEGGSAFRKLQYTLAGEEIWVDWLGRTREEAEEEEGLVDGLGGYDEDEQGSTISEGVEQMSGSNVGDIGVAGPGGEQDAARPSSWFLELFERYTQRWRKRPAKTGDETGEGAGHTEASLSRGDGKTPGGVVLLTRDSPSSLDTVTEAEESEEEEVEHEETHKPFWSEGEDLPTPPIRSYSPSHLAD